MPDFSGRQRVRVTRRAARVGLVLYLALLGVLVVAIYHGFWAMQAG